VRGEKRDEEDHHVIVPGLDLGFDWVSKSSRGEVEAAGEPSFYSFFSEQQVQGPGFVMYRYEAHLHKVGELMEEEEDGLASEEQYDLLSGHSLSDSRVTQYLLSQAESGNLPALWRPPDWVEEDEPSSSSASPGFNFSKRRTKQLSFTCKLCLTRMTKLINPHAWENGAIVIRCDGCGVKHQLVDNLGVFDLLQKPLPKGKKKKKEKEMREEDEKDPPRHLWN